MPFPPHQTSFHAIGAMSGSSLDGLDLALCQFHRSEQGWQFEVVRADTVKYSAEFAARFIRAMHGTALELMQLDRDLGKFIGQGSGQLALDQQVDLISSHGHTIFHKPDEQLTTQIGAGASIAAESGLLTVSDLRSLDMALGGQGAPLVPIGEASLFPDYQAFLNLGGIANVSLHGDSIIGYDVCICNQLLNKLAMEQQLDYDADGAIARSGSVDQTLLTKLNALPFHQQEPPKSLGREWFEEAIRPVFEDSNATVSNKLATAVEHMAVQISAAFEDSPDAKVLVTGGGAFNGFLMERIQDRCAASMVIPDTDTVAYKEAIIFAFLGLLRILEHPNTLASVTGAPFDSVGGCVHMAPSTSIG